MSTAALISSLSALEVTLWLEEERLRYRAPAGALSPALRAELAARKDELVAHLRQVRALGRVHGLFEAQAERTPDAPAVVFEGQALSYRELEARANQVAGQLVAMGVMRGSLVGIHVERSLEMVVGVLGVLKAGAAYVPLDPGFPADRLAYMVADAGAAVVLTQAQLPQVGHAPRLCFDRDAAAIAARPTARVDGGATGGDLAYVIYTSGSTGRPKGVEVQHASVVNLLRSIAEEPGLGASDTVVAVTSLSFDTAVADLYWPLSVGARIVIASRSVACDGFALAQLLSDSGATLMQATPATWRILLGASWTNPGKIRVLSTGEALPPSLAAELLARTDQLWNLYGPTETTVWSTLCRIESATAPIGVGHPVANTRTYVVDAQGQPVPVGVPGELCLGGAGLARGYLGRPELTASQFVVDPFSPEPGARMYRTGDLVRQRQDGSLECLGRLDHQVKIRGFRIELGEIEAALCGHASVTQAVVVARETAGAARLVGYVVGEPGLCTSALRAHLEQELPGYMVPAQLVVLAAMPLGPTGKIDRKALPDVEADPALDHVAPRDATEELLAGIWSEVLGVERVGVHDDFFALGGHSLLATQLVSRVRHAFGVEVPVRALFEAPTLAAFRGCLAGAAASTALPLERAPRDSKLPLSFSQQRLWFLDQLEPGSPAYNMPAALRLRGTLEVATLRRVFAEVVRRHEVLRTRLVADAGQPHQVVDAPSDWPLPVVELAHLGAAQAEAETLRLAAEEARRPFDLAAGPLLRTTLLRLAPAHHVLLVTLHHVVADAWSIEVLVREIAALFAAFSRDQPSPLPELAIQYADFASWQRHALSADALGTSLAYWKAQLAGVPVLELPTDRPRPPVQSYAGARVPLVLPSELTRALLRLSREENATLFMTLLAAFDVLVCRYSGQTDLCVGTAVACRTRPEIEPLIGMFVNSLALRSDLSGDPSFVEVLARVRAMTLGAYAHQDLPIDGLVEHLEVHRDTSRTPLFQVMFSFQSAPVPEVSLAGLTLAPIDVETHVAKYDLSFDLREADGEVRGEIEYATALFDGATIERLGGHFRQLLEGIVAEKHAHLSQLPLLTDPERTALLVEWNGADEVSPASWLPALFEAQVERTPEAVALVLGERRISYRELNASANRIAHHLRAMGVGPGVPVAVCLERSSELIVAMLGVFKSGGAYVPLDPAYPFERLAFVLEDAGAAVVLTAEDLTDQLPTQFLQVVAMDSDREAILRASAENPPAGSPDDLAYVIYTSGSTGKPKGVLVPHEAIGRHSLQIAREYQIGPADRVLQFASLTFDVSLEQILPTLISGATLVMRGQDAWSTSELHRQVRAHGITVADLTPAYWKELAREWRDQPELAAGNPLRLITVGGDVMSAEGLAAWRQSEMRRVRLVNAYGPTEATITATLFEVDPSAAAAERRVPIGRPLPGRKVHILDRQGNLVPVGVPGEVHLGGAGIALGYLNQPQLTSEKFVRDPFSVVPTARLYRTGDLARWLPDGTIDYLGRIDHQVKVRGFRIELGEIESALRTHPAIREAAVTAAEAPGGDRRLVAYVVLEEDATLTGAEACKFVGSKLPAYMVPSSCVTLGALPLLRDGSVDRQTLLLALASEQPAAPALAPRTKAERAVAALWCEVLGVAAVGVEDDFFALGGHSLLATQVLSRVRDTLRVELPLSALFEAPTLAGFAARVDAAAPLAQSADRIQPLARADEGGLPLSFAQERLWFLDRLAGHETTYYNMAAALRLSGALDVAALERSLSEIVRRHEVLRTTFALVGEQPLQTIQPATSLPLPVLDLEGLALDLRGAEVLRLARLEEARPFDLEKGPLLRVTLLRCDAREHVLLLTMHHIASDGWSVAIFGRELGELYNALSRGEPSPLPPLRVQYADFAAWEHAPAQLAALEEQLAYWKTTLAGAPDLALPTDRPHPATPSWRGATCRLFLAPELARKLEALAKAQGTTLFMTLLAAFKTLLFRYSGQEDLVVGTDVANRNHAETEDLIGFFVNQLVLRSRVSASDSFADVLARVRCTTLAAYAHQDVPFQTLVARLSANRDRSRPPLFSAKLVLQNTPAARIDLADLTISALPSDRQLANFDLTLTVVEQSGGLDVELEYLTDLFDRSTIVQLAANLEALLEDVTADPSRPVAALRLAHSVAAADLPLGDFGEGELSAMDLDHLEMALSRLQGPE